jgi:signal transduction histidine kinase
MIVAPLPDNESERLNELYRYALLDTETEKDFDDIVTLASQICNTPISTITLIDASRQWFKSSVGLKDRETSRDKAFCAHAILEDDIMIVNDAMRDERFADNPLVTGDPHIRFYAGMPLITPAGYKLGTLCVIDRIPKTLNQSQLFSLRVLARQVVKQFELRLKVWELEEQKKELKKINRANNRLLSIIGHDLRRPLSLLAGLIQLNEKKALSPNDFQQLLGDIKVNLYSTGDLLENLLEWAMHQFSGKDLRKERILIDVLINREIEKNRHFLDLKKNKVKSNLTKNLAVLADENALSFVIRNLILNANKFCDAGKISILVLEHENEIEVKVSDTGIGIEEQHRESLFDGTFSNSKPGTKGEKGSGLGLPLCKELVEKHGGKIWVQSAPGKGSTFTFTLPQQKV